jgi:hypothetical protein
LALAACAQVCSIAEMDAQHLADDQHRQ